MLFLPTIFYLEFFVRICIYVGIQLGSQYNELVVAG